MDSQPWDIRIKRLQEIKEVDNLDGLLMVDRRGYEYYKNGIETNNKGHQIHGLYQLSQLLFPNEADRKEMCVVVEGEKTKNILKKTQDEDIMVMRVVSKDESQ